jgi:cell division protein FtsB
MAKVSIDVEAAVELEIQKRDRKLEALTKANARLEQQVKEYHEKLATIKALQQAIVNAAVLIDPWAQGDD